MNLLGKFPQIHIKVFVLIFLASCQSIDNIDLQLEIAEFDTTVKYKKISIPCSTVYLDSLRTDGNENMIVGNNNDDVSGSINVIPFANVSYNSGYTADTDTLDIIDSSLHLDVQNIISNKDADSVYFELEIAKCTENVLSTVIYTHVDSFEVFEKPLDTLRFWVQSDGGMVKVPITSQLASALWGNLISDNTTSAENIYCIKLKPLKNDGLLSIDCINNNTYFELVHDDGSDITDLEYTYMKIVDFFHHVNRDRSESLIEPLVNTGDFLSETSFSYISNLAGTLVKFDLSELISFVETLPDNTIIDHSEFTIGMSPDHTNPISSNMDNLIMYFFQTDIVINGPLAYNNRRSQIMGAENQYRGGLTQLRVFDFNSPNGQFKEDITFFVQTYLDVYYEDIDYPTSALVAVPSEQLTPEEAEKAIPTNQMSLDRAKIINEEVYIEIYYTTLAEQ